MDQQNRHIKIGELEIPIDYFSFNEKEKEELCLAILNSMLILLDKNVNHDVDKKDLLDKILQSSIMVNNECENYEMSGILLDIRKILNE